MKIVRKKANFISILMATLMLLVVIPYQPILAAMISTNMIIDSNRAQKAREYLKNEIFREDVQNYLIAKGIDPFEAKERVDSLSDSEVIAIADQIEQLPAGGNAIGVIVGAALIVFLVLLLTDILGYTDVFPFVKAKK